MRWQIMIPTLPERHASLSQLVTELLRQTVEAGLVWGEDVDVIIHDAPRGVKNVGEKRDEMTFGELFVAEYGSHHDDDDFPAPNYIKRGMEGIEKGVDCCSLRGIITWNGLTPEVFEHSIRYSKWETTHTGDVKYLRPPNHLNIIKRSIMQQFRFKHLAREEDRIWSEEIQASGLIKTEHYIDEVIYNYKFVQNK